MERPDFEELLRTWQLACDEKDAAFTAYVTAFPDFEALDEQKRTGAMPPERERLHAAIRASRVASGALHDAAQLLLQEVTS